MFSGRRSARSVTGMAVDAGAPAGALFVASASVTTGVEVFSGKTGKPRASNLRPCWRFFQRKCELATELAARSRPAAAVAVVALQSAMFLDPLNRIGIQHFAPDIGVVTGRVIAGESVREIWTAITRRNWRKIYTSLVQGIRFESHRVFRHIGRV